MNANLSSSGIKSWRSILKGGRSWCSKREIREIDVEKGGRRIKTSFLGIAGEPEPRDSFGVGQYVLVNGTLHPDGYVAAFVVQKIVKPQEVKFIYKPNVESQAKARKTGRRPVAPAASSN